MIRTHDFNSAWWGDKVGIIDDAHFFSLDPAEREERLAPYAWVEYVGRFDSMSPAQLASQGFFQSDTQIPFKVNLRRLPELPSVADLELISAKDQPFTIDASEFALFANERYRLLPGVTPERLNDRYERYGNGIIAAQPELSFRALHQGRVQGWFLSDQSDHGFTLTLAMLSKDAQISGMSLYHTALYKFAELGKTTGGARFSITNTPVHNMYASLGARFLTPLGCWLWVRPTDVTR